LALQHRLDGSSKAKEAKARSIWDHRGLLAICDSKNAPVLELYSCLVFWLVVIDSLLCPKIVRNTSESHLVHGTHA